MKEKKIKILIAPNSYKESADSVKAAELFHENLKELEADFIMSPLSDGGDGFLKVISFNKKTEIKNYEVSAPWKYFNEQVRNEKIKVPAGYSESEKILYIETADIFGMKIMPLDKRNPLLLTTEGLGELLLLIKEEVKNNILDVNKVVIGIGGTGTADMGMGVLSALGLRMSDIDNNPIAPIPLNFIKASKVEFNPVQLPFKIDLILDVNNDLLGDQGGLRIYSPQKGASLKNIEQIESGIKNLLRLCSFKIQSGAGGGLATGLSLLNEVSNISSARFLNDYLNLNNLIDQSDIIITGEGKFDRQSSFNKAAGVIMTYEKIKPIFLCCGVIEGEITSKNVIPVQFSDFFSNQKESINNIETAINKACRIILTRI